MPDLLATCWTSAGNVRPGLTPDISPVPLLERVQAVAAAGFTGIGFELADLDAFGDGIGFAAVRAVLADNGIDFVEVEFLNDWWLTGPKREESDRRRSRLLDAATRLGAHHVKLGTGGPGDTRDPDVLLEAFVGLADDAAAAGTRIAIETGAGSALDLVVDAIPLVRRAAHPAAGLLLDPWHFVRSGTPYDIISDLSPAEIVAVELSDGAAEAVGPFFDDTFDNRLVPGSGDFDVSTFVRRIREIGWSGIWGVEMMSTPHRELPVSVALEQAASAARSCFPDDGE